MKNLLCILFFLPMMIWGQDIKMQAEYGSKNKDIRDILLFEGIDKYDVKFIGSEIKNKHFKIIVKTLWDGKITKTDTLLDTREMLKKSIIDSDTLPFSIMAKKFTADQLKIQFEFKNFSNVKMYEATHSLEYSFRVIGDRTKIEIGKPFPAFAYILPYEKNGWKLYCAVDSSGKDVENWGKEFGIKHYMIYEILFE